MDLPKRKWPRLTEYDYAAPNFYFITLCTHSMRCLFGTPEHLNTYGQVAQEELLAIPNHYTHVQIDKYIIMPNHIHAIVVIDSSCQTDAASRAPTLSSIVGAYKSGVSRKIHKINPTISVWQRNFYDHIIRNEKSYQKIWTYIHENPLKWDLDSLYNLESSM